MEADEKKCPQCAEIVKAEAKVCRFCSHPFEAEVSSTPSSSPAPNKGKAWGKGCLVVLGLLFALAVFGSLVAPVKQPVPASKSVVSEGEDRKASTASDTSAGAKQAPPPLEGPDSAPSFGLFGPQANAARSARQYLDISGFSRRGLIQQLSSDAGNGYDVADATAAVDSLTVDWNEQAVRSAKQYLDISGFSCSGLIEQLSSSAGSKYTKAEARYGAQQAGAC